MQEISFTKLKNKAAEQAPPHRLSIKSAESHNISFNDLKKKNN